MFPAYLLVSFHDQLDLPAFCAQLIGWSPGPSTVLRASRFARPVRSLAQSGYAVVPIRGWFVAPRGAHLPVAYMRRFSSLPHSFHRCFCARITADTFLGSCPVTLFSRRWRETVALHVRFLLLSVADAETVGVWRWGGMFLPPPLLVLFGPRPCSCLHSTGEESASLGLRMSPWTVLHASRDQF